MLSDTVTEEHVADVISRSTGIPLGSLLQGESERLLRMEEVLKESVVGQVGCVVGLVFGHDHILHIHATRREKRGAGSNR